MTIQRGDGDSLPNREGRGAIELGTYKWFPPRRRNIGLPVQSSGAAAATLLLWAPCRPLAIAVQRVAYTLIQRSGVGVLPGRRARWEPPWNHVEWAEVEDSFRSLVGQFDAVGVYERRQSNRSGFALLLVTGARPVAFVRVARHLSDNQASKLEHEFATLTLIANQQPESFVAPHPIALGQVGEWEYLIMSPLADTMHAPAVRVADEMIVEEIQERLGKLPRPVEIPEHWKPMHGDLTPWNLRAIRDERPRLVDWEDAGWGPPGADLALLRATRTAVLGTALQPAEPEAVQYWIDRVEERSHMHDRRLHRDVLRVLPRMRSL